MSQDAEKGNGFVPIPLQGGDKVRLGFVEGRAEFIANMLCLTGRSCDEDRLHLMEQILFVSLPLLTGPLTRGLDASPQITQFVKHTPLMGKMRIEKLKGGNQSLAAIMDQQLQSALTVETPIFEGNQQSLPCRLTFVLCHLPAQNAPTPALRI